MPMVYILIPAHNNKRDVLELLQCLSSQTYKYITVVLVDDGSTDGTEDKVREHFPATFILKGDGNLWWTGANVIGVNYILKQAGDDDFILLLNNDLIVKENYIEILVDAGIRNERAVTGSALVDYHNPDFIESGIKLNRFLDLRVNQDSDLIHNTDFDFNVDTLPGRGTLVPIEVFRKIGNFNFKKLPHYGADYEFSIRAKRAGFKLIVSNRARVIAKLNISGINTSDKRTISLRECFDLLISKKSRTNPYYYLNYIWLCSEEGYKARNLFHSGRGILMETIGKTFPFYLIFYPVIFSLRMIKKMFLFMYVFSSKHYPLRYSDIEDCGLNPKELLHQGILFERKFEERVFYYINHDASVDSLSSDRKDNFSSLKSRSFSYLHKLAIIREKINILLGKEVLL